MTRLRNAIASVLSSTRTVDHPTVHFHNGPQGSPAPCFDEQCGSPRLGA
ncbi:MAG TPA: hypothetical protein VGI67_11545 [Thermoleophilaceae bacterium]|jgi:hypothetical protein